MENPLSFMLRKTQSAKSSNANIEKVTEFCHLGMFPSYFFSPFFPATSTERRRIFVRILSRRHWRFGPRD